MFVPLWGQRYACIKKTYKRRRLPPGGGMQNPTRCVNLSLLSDLLSSRLAFVFAGAKRALKGGMSTPPSSSRQSSSLSSSPIRQVLHTQ